MTHADAESLTLLALGEDAVPTVVVSHVRGCASCSSELATLRAVVDHARAAADTVVSSPSPQVWTSIQDALAGGLTPLPGEGDLAAHATLFWVPADPLSAAGEADLGTDDEGRRMLRVTLHGDLSAQGLRQAWLVHRGEPGRRQTLGIMDGASGLWSVDRSIDLRQFTLLEISQQEIGVAEHSGDVVARGELMLAAA